MPGTRLGRWSVRVIAFSALCFTVFFLLVASGQKGGDTFFANPWLSGTILAAGVSAVIGAGIGLVAVVKQQERSPVVFVTIALGLLVLAYGIVEVAVPH